MKAWTRPSKTDLELAVKLGELRNLKIPEFFSPLGTSAKAVLLTIGSGERPLFRSWRAVF